MEKKSFYLSIFCQHFAYGLIIPSLIIWQNKNGLNFGQIGLIQSLGIAAILISEMPSSYLADKISKKLTLIFGFLLSIFSFYFLINAKTFFDFAIVQILFSVGLGFFSGTQESTLYDISENEAKITKNLGHMSIIDELATISGMAASSLVIKFLNIEKTFVIAFIFMIIGLISIVLLNIKKIKETKIQNNKIKININNKVMLIIALIFAALSMRGEILFQAHFSNIYIQISQLGFIYLTAKIFSMIGSYSADLIENKLGILNGLVFSAIIQIISFSMLIFGNKILAIIALSIFFFSENIFRNIRDGYLLKIAPKNLKSTFLSSISFSSSIFLFLINPIIGILIDNKFLYAIITIILIKIFALSLLIRKNIKALTA